MPGKDHPISLLRLTEEQVQLTKQAIAHVLGGPAAIWLFGPRVDDTLRGGDIDLLVETPSLFPNRTEIICRPYGVLVMVLVLGERKIDILFKDGRTSDKPNFQAARQAEAQL